MSWQVGDGPRRAGRVEFSGASLELDSPSETDRIGFGEIVSVALAHGRLRLERAGMNALVFTSLDGPGALRELADRVAVAAHLPG